MVSEHKSLGSKIQLLRQKAGYTQDELSDRAGLSYSTLAKIERGAIKNPSVFTVSSIATVLKTTVEQLLIKQPTIITPKSTKTKVKFVYVDMNGVMVRFFQRAFATLSEETDVMVDKIESAFWHYNDAANRGDLSINDFNEAMAQHLHINKFNWTEYYLDAVEPIKETEKLLRSLSGKIKLGMLTNTMPGFINELKKKKYIPDIKYDAVVDSSEVKAIKPEAKIYEIAEQMSGCKGSEIFFVDDSRTNLMAAERFGWRVLWFDDFRPKDSVDRILKSLDL
jgi:HAD superfamily hydrolase (TIGR01509 family)